MTGNVHPGTANRAVPLSVHQGLYTDLKFRVPDYQRNYAWSEPEILQLVDDLTDAATEQGAQYFLGNLVTAQTSGPTGSWDVIDGQQRLTTLYLLFLVLKLRYPQIYDQQPSPLTYQSRSKATHTLAWLAEHPVIEDWNDDVDDHDAGILEGYRILYQYLAPTSTADQRHPTHTLGTAQAEKFLLNNVIFVQITLPHGTNLNRYFEVMNTRGAQLRQDEIVKARLMSRLRPQDQSTFGRIWDACADMQRYVQTTLAPQDPTLRAAARNRIFGQEWNWIATDDFEEIKQALGAGPAPQRSQPEAGPEGMTLDEAILHSAPPEEVGEDTGTQRFRSAFGFSSFLLRAELIFYPHPGSGVRGLSAEPAATSRGSFQVPIDDKQLIEVFAQRFPRDGDPEDVKTFITDLLILRVLFDQFILKRDLHSGDSDEGQWALQTMRVSRRGQGRGRPIAYSPYYSGTFSPGETTSPGGWGVEQTNQQNRLRMLQSALRITYVSPRSMHWVTTVLGELWTTVSRHRRAGGLPPRTLITADDLITVLESYARQQVRPHLQGTFPLEGKPPLEGGLAIERIIFTYLDYLLLVQEGTYDVRFTFRTSIEHFYPSKIDDEARAHPDGAMTQEVKDTLGNLALVTVSENSKFSNYRPEHKATMGQIVKQSPKLQLMARITQQSGWDKEAILAHHQQMLALLSQDVSLSEDGSVLPGR